MTRTKPYERGRSYVVVSAFACVLLTAQVALGQFSGFLEEYPELQPLENMPGLVWKAPDVAGKYRAVYFDAPEIFLDPDSEYKGVRPDAVQTLSDTMREIFTEDAVKRGLEVADELGADVLRVRSALTNVYFRRRSRSFRYPTSSSAVQLRAAVGRDVSLVEATIEAEVLDGETGVRLGVIITQKGQRQVKELDVPESPASWSDLVATLKRLSATAINHFGSLFDETSQH